MIKIFSKAFELLKENIIVVQPLIIYLLMIGFIAAPISISNLMNYRVLLSIVTVLLFTAAFFAGWFYIVKLAISMRNEVYETPEERSLAAISLLKQFFTGVGEYFVPMTFALIFYIVLIAGFSFAVYKFGVHHFGALNLNADILKAINSGSYQDLYHSLSINNIAKTDQIRLFHWSIYISLASFIFSFLSLFYGAVILYDTRNPIKAVFLSLKFILFNFWGSLIVFLFLSLLNTILSILNIFSAMNVLISIISLLLLFLYMSYHVMLVFLYYEEKTQDSCGGGA